MLLYYHPYLHFIRRILKRTYTCAILSYSLSGILMSSWEITISSCPRAWARIVWRTEYIYEEKSIRVYARRQFTYYNTYYHEIGSKMDEYRRIGCVFRIVFRLFCWYHALVYVNYNVSSPCHSIVISVITSLRVKLRLVSSFERLEGLFNFFFCLFLYDVFPV